MALKIMYLSPWAASAGDDPIFVEMAKQYKLPETEVHVTSLPDNVGRYTNLEFGAYGGMVHRAVIRAARAAGREGFDALAIGCFYDTALYFAREMSGAMFVTGPCISSCEIAASISHRFGVIVGRQKWVREMEGNVREYGYGSRLAGFYEVGLGVEDFQKDHSETARRLIEVGRIAVERDHAEAIILGCTLEIGFHEKVQSRLGVPVIDPAIAALKRAEYGALLKQQCGLIPSRKWSSASPSEEELALFGGFDDGEIFGNRVIVPAEMADPAREAA